MIGLVTDAFGSEIMQRALIGGLVTATLTSLIGTWVVVRGLAFFGDAMAHGVLPGIALAAVWGFDLTLGAAASAVVMVLGINLAHRTTRLSDDTGIGLLFVGMLALGVVIISRQSSFSGDLSLTVVTSFRVAVTLLVFGLLVAPPATAVLLVRRLPIAMVVAVGFGWSSVVIGLVVSDHADTAASATVAGVAVAQFFLVLAAAELRRALLTPSPIH